MSNFKFQISNFKKAKTARKNLEWEDAKELKKDVEDLLKVVNLPHVNTSRLFFYRTQGSKSRSYARIWAMPKIFQRALGIKPAYVIEVLSKYFDKLNKDEQKKVLIHELLHIPKNFSGSLLSHRGRGRHLGNEVNRLFKEYKQTAE